ncbi:MAG: fumarylacetoacetate hydrolase family protein [Candidatus Thorarchaeota archaeon]|nr:fumarylacetoacetate hydrolase family protein [Candidatus Thorarchaeota archaeon]
MRLVTYSRLGVPSCGIELENGVLDIPDAASRFGRTYHVKGKKFPDTIVDLLRWDAGIQVVQQILDRYATTPLEERPMTLRPKDIRLEAPIYRPGKIIGLGLNYRDHAEETKREIPAHPVVFAKFPSSVIGPDEEIPFPGVTKKLDWEVELGVVIGKTCKNVRASDAKE